jgi:pre-mRNA-splicing factor SYF1
VAPEDREDFVDYLKSIDWLEEAAQELAKIVNDERFVSKHGKSNHQLWNELCEMISQNPDKIT